MNIVFEKYARRIIVDMSLSRFAFRNAKDNSIFNVDTFLYLDNSKSKSSIVSIGEIAPEKYLSKPDVYRVNVFDTGNSFPPKSTVNRNDLIEIIFKYGLSWFYRNDIIPRLRPIVFILGTERFNDYFANPKDDITIAAKNGGAKEIIFDKTDL